METISGYEAIARMRNLRHNEHTFFQMQHLTFDSTRQTSKGIRSVDRCRLREALPDDAFENTTAELFLPYIDLGLPKGKQNKMCRKKLIRFIAFPPDYVLTKVNWFTNE